MDPSHAVSGLFSLRYSLTLPPSRLLLPSLRRCNLPSPLSFWTHHRTIPCQCDEPSEPILAAEREWLKSSRAAFALDASSTSSSTSSDLAFNATSLLARKVGEEY